MSKKFGEWSLQPNVSKARARISAREWTRSAMSLSPSGPWYTAYMEAMTARSTWAVQMLLVALSRRMCCSRVCRARR